LFPYTEKQYSALKEVTDHFRSEYEALNSPHRVLGHEHIAGWRGKVDPGSYFDWPKFYEGIYGEIDVPIRNNLCHPEIADSFKRFLPAAPIADSFKRFLPAAPKDSEISSQYWHAVSHAMETSNRLRQMPEK